MLSRGCSSAVPQFTCFTSTKVQILTPEELQDFLGLPISSVSQLDYEASQEVADDSRVLSTCGFAWGDLKAGGRGGWMLASPFGKEV